MNLDYCGGCRHLNVKARRYERLPLEDFRNMNEDAIYRTSTQYRYWSFTSETLASLRSSTNALAAERVRAAIKRAQEARSAPATVSPGLGDGNNNEANTTAGNKEGAENPKQVQCLTVEEEQKLVGFYCVKAMELADFCNFPTNVKVVLAQV